MINRMKVAYWSIIFWPSLLFSQNVLRPQEVTFSSVVGSGARAFGMGGAFIAITDDATAASWNPAGLAQLEKAEASVVFAVNDFDTNFPSLTIEFNGAPLQVSKQFTSMTGSNIDFFSFTYPFRKGSYKLVPQISFQRVINLSLDPKLEKPFTASGQINPTTSFTAQFDQDGKSSGGLDIVSASFAVQFSSTFSLGAAFNYWFGDQQGNVNSNLTASFDPPIVPPQTLAEREEVDAEASGFNINLGALLKPVPKVNLGFIFKTPFTLDYEETNRSFSEGEIDSANSFTQTSDFAYPYSVGLGVAFRPTDQLTFSTDFTFSNWSEGKIKKNERRFLDGTRRTPDNVPFPGNGADENGEFREQNDTRQLRFGAEYVFLKDQLIIPIRAGFFTNTPYITDGNDESISYRGFTVGTGIGVKDFLFDAALVVQSGDSFVSASSQGDREFKSKQVYFSAIYRFPW